MPVQERRSAHPPEARRVLRKNRARWLPNRTLRVRIHRSRHKCKIRPISPLTDAKRCENLIVPYCFRKSEGEGQIGIGNSQTQGRKYGIGSSKTNSKANLIHSAYATFENATGITIGLAKIRGVGHIRKTVHPKPYGQSFRHSAPLHAGLGLRRPPFGLHSFPSGF